jgi:RHS repeat-associated protein
MRARRFLMLLAVGVLSQAQADTVDNVWNATVAMNVPGGSNPLQGQVFRNFAKARDAVRGAHADSPFLVQKSQTAGDKGSNIVTKFWIPPANVSEWDAWDYGGDSVVDGWNGGCEYPYDSEQEVIDCTVGPRSAACSVTYLPTSGWTVYHDYPTYQQERRTYELTVKASCSSTPAVSSSIVNRVRYKICPTAAPWYGAAPDSNGFCSNGLTADVTQNRVLGGCQTESDGRKEDFGNPCNAGTGNKTEAEPDYRGVGLEFTRHYNSSSEIRPVAGFGENWTHNYAKKLRFRTGSSSTVPAVHVRGDGQAEVLSLDFNGWIGERSGAHVLDVGTEWELHGTDGSLERYGADGRLLWIENAVGQRTVLSYVGSDLATVTGPFGHTLQLGYDDGRLITLTDPAGGVYEYDYGAGGMLESVTYPDATTRVYHYEDSANPFALTGVTDENGDRYSTFAYNADGLVVLTEHAGGYGEYTFTYNADTSTTVTDARGNVTTLQFASVLNSGSAGRRRPTSFTTGGQTFARTYVTGENSPHRVATTTDENGVLTSYAYTSNPHRLSSKTEASGTTVARTTSYQYLNWTRLLIKQVSTPSVKSGSQRKVITTFDSEQRPQTITVSGFTPSGTAVSRAVTLSYNSYDQITQVNGPRTDVTDVTTLDYYECTTGDECGQLESVTNALGHVTTFDAYDEHGRLLEMTDPNGVLTEYAYDDRGRTTSVSETPAGGTARITTYTYDDAGLLERVESPNGTILTYDYDAAHNLLSITDNLGNAIEYGYDLNGNRTSEDTRDASSNLRKTIDLTYDARNRVESINSAGSITDLVFDALGNLTDETDPNSNDTGHDHDPLNRLVQTVDALSGMTEYGYDKNDQLTSVEAPNGATTTYVYDDLGNLLALTSPDTGTTTYTYDAAGNRTGQTDANSVAVAYTYDALNRLTAIDYPGSNLDVTLTYDQGTDQKGRLTTMADGSGSATFEYDGFGNLTEETKTIGGNAHVTAYVYDEAHLVTSMTYPSGGTIDYTRNVLGQVTTVASTYDGSAATLASSAAYEPFGPLKGLTFGNSLVLARTFDQQYRLTDQTTGAVQDLQFTLDNAGNIDAISDAVSASLSQGFGQDALHRVTTDAGSYGTKSFTYDGVGNRLTRVHGATTQTLTYTASSNRMATHDGQTVTLDAAGNTLGNPAENLSFTYGAHNRMLEAYVGGVLKATYVYDGRGQRMKKIEATGAQRTFIYHYGQGGELIGETVYSSVGAKIGERDYVWLDTLPIVQSERAFSGGSITSSQLVYLHADQLNTPRLATNASGAVVWRWDSDAFGTGAANQDPDSDTSLVNIRLRFPGQYLDEETGLHYNYFRDYDAVTGRYIQSDPIGLAGGLNPYLYANGNPLRYGDPYGLFGLSDATDAVFGAVWHATGGWSPSQSLVDGAAGFGDTLSFGGTNVLRNWMGVNGGVDRCSAAYRNGELGAMGLSIAFGGAHLGRNALYQMGSSGLGTGLRRLASDRRTWDSVRDSWSLAAGGGQRWLAANGQSLHHWLIPQRFAQVNAGFNYMPISAGFNSWMNGSTAARTAVEWGFRGSVAGIYGAPVTAALSGGDCSCQR